MGFWFSNIHIRKTDTFNDDVFYKTLAELLYKQGFLPAKNAEDSDFAVSVCLTGGKWISVCSDGIEFYTKKSMHDICEPLSKLLETDVLMITCFDSDCLLLNGINHNRKTDAWIKVGRYPGIMKRSTPARWKGLIADTSRLKDVLSRKYVFAEEALEQLEPLLEIEQGQACFCPELITDKVFADHAQTFYFSLPEMAQKPELPRFLMPISTLMPCVIGENTILCAVNDGGKSTGLAIAFSGKYVENEEIRFRDVQLEYAFDRYPRPTIPLQLEKRKMADGQWVYYAELPKFQIPAGVKKGTPIMKMMEEQYKRNVGVRFTPEGDARKRLDIKVHFIPLKNPDGQCEWCVWQVQHGSKREYVQWFNNGRREPQFLKEQIDVTTLDPDD